MSVEARLRASRIFTPIIAAVGLIIYFAALFHFTLVPGVIPSAIRYAIMPLVFAFPWILFIFIFQERTTNAFSNLSEKTTIIPFRWRLFYGFNTLIIVAFFLLPFVSPLLAVFAALVLAWRIVYHSEFIWNKGPSARLLYTALLFCLIAALPVFLLIFWFQQFFFYIVPLIINTWIALVDPIYFVSCCLVDALAVGALLHLSYGTLDAKGKVLTEKGGIVWVIWFIEAVIAGLLFVFVNPWFDPFGFGLSGIDPLLIGGTIGFLFYINMGCLALVVITYITKFCAGIQSETKLSILGILFLFPFILVELFRTFDFLPMKEILMVASSLIFVIAYVIAFFTASDKDTDLPAIEKEGES
jgi:hypothetical protein